MLELWKLFDSVLPILLLTSCGDVYRVSGGVVSVCREYVERCLVFQALLALALCHTVDGMECANANGMEYAMEWKAY